MLFDDEHDFSEESKEKIKNLKANIKSEVKTIFKDHTEPIGILIGMKKVFNILPFLLKQNRNDDYKFEKEFTLYLLLNYTSVPKDLIMDQFQVDLSQLSSIENDPHADEKFAKMIDKFFTFYEFCFVKNYMRNLAFKEKVLLFLEMTEKNHIDLSKFSTNSED